MFLASECWSVDVNETEKEELFWEIGLDLGKEKTTQKWIKSCVYNDHKYLFTFKKSAVCSNTVFRSELIFVVI